MACKDCQGKNPSVDSMVGRLARLDIGETETRAIRIECDKATKDTIMETINKLRSNIAATVKQAVDKTGHKYTVETGDIRTRSFDFLLIVAVTRLA
jgi:hypothetical protein